MGQEQTALVYSGTSIFKIKLNFVAGLSVKPSFFWVLDV